MTEFPENFVDMEFPAAGDVCYVFLMRYPAASDLLPFYVGESSRHVGRIGDYVRANFTAATDFKVGEAVKYLRKRKIEVLVRFWECSDRKKEEQRVLSELRKSYILLNDMKGYRVGDTTAEAERARIAEFMESIIGRAHVAGGAEREKDVSVASGNKSVIPLMLLEWLKLNFPLNSEVNRSQILAWARENGLNEGSILPADWCSNTVTGRWSKHRFLRSIGRGRYIYQGTDV